MPKKPARWETHSRTSLADVPATPTLPAQVSPPAFALSGKTPLQLGGIEAMAFPFTSDDGQPALGPEAAEKYVQSRPDVSAFLTTAGPRAGSVELHVFGLEKESSGVAPPIFGELTDR